MGRGSGSGGAVGFCGDVERGIGGGDGDGDRGGGGGGAAVIEGDGGIGIGAGGERVIGDGVGGGGGGADEGGIAIEIDADDRAVGIGGGGGEGDIGRSGEGGAGRRRGQADRRRLVRGGYRDFCGGGGSGSLVVGHGQGHGVTAGLGVGFSRGYSGARGAVAEIPGIGDDTAVRVVAGAAVQREYGADGSIGRGRGDTGRRCEIAVTRVVQAEFIHSVEKPAVAGRTVDEVAATGGRRINRGR